ncbi:MAG: hypothetical protein JRI59_11135, partial [Deltaproteobacteria bacterium]|nr:hypothetical protein [Deltaproteobacteria bacterium]
RDPFNIVLPFLGTYWFLYVLKFFALKDILHALFPEDLVLWGMLMALAGLAAFYCGCRSRLSPSLALALPRVPARWPAGALFPYAVLLFLLAAAGEALFISRSGGWLHFFSFPRGAGDYQHNTAYLYNLRWLSAPAGAFLAVEILANRLQGVKKLVGAGLLGLSIAYFFFLGQRSAMLLFGLLLAGAWFYARPSRPRRILPLALVFLPFLLAAGIIGLCRSEFHLDSSWAQTRALLRQDKVAVLQALGQNLLYTGSEPDNPHQEPVLYLGVLQAVPERVDYDYGKPYLNYLVHWIPRLWWPEKPNFRLEGVRRLEGVMGTDLKGPVLTILGYFYANLGPAGVLLGMYLTGLGLTVIYLWFRSQPDSLGAMVLYLPLIHYGVLAAFCQGIFALWDTFLPFFVVPTLGGFLYLRLLGHRHPYGGNRRRLQAPPGTRHGLSGCRRGPAAG